MDISSAFYDCGRIAMPFAMQQLIAAAVKLFATAPPALLSRPRTSAAVTELLIWYYYCCKQRFRDAYAQMQAPTAWKLVHHHASTSWAGAPHSSSMRRECDQAEPSRERTRHAQPAPWKKIGGPIDTRALACRADVQEAFRNATQPTAPPRLCSQPRAAPRRHHCRAHGPERHRRQDV